MPDRDPSSDQAVRLGRPAMRNAYATAVNRWAIIVGIAKYRHSSLDLKYADRDAEDLYRLLQTASGGAFEKDRIKKLINEEATTAAVTGALRGFLFKPAPEDVVLMYFACHGAPDPRRPNVLYLLTHDTDPADIASTALRMSEINLSLQDYVLATRVVIIADTCHSAAIANAGARAAGGGAGLMNTYLEKISDSRGGVALLTSAEASEVSLEDEKWGGGHGVFTHFLLEGLRGGADGHLQPKDGIVSVGELFEFVRDKVKEATGDGQHPAIGPTDFDRNLPLAVTGGIDAQQYWELGSDLYALAARLDDAGRFASAARDFAEALRLSRLAGVALPAAECELGRCLLAAGDTQEAIAALEQATAGEISDPSAWLLLGLARVRNRDLRLARQALTTFLQRETDHEHAGWVADYVNSLEQASGARRALLIGINRYANSEVMDLAGCVNDVLRMRELLVTKLDFPAEHVRILVDDQATGETIRAALAALAAESAPSDVVVVHFSGHSVPELEAGGESHFGAKPSDTSADQRQNNTYLITFETRSVSSQLTGGVTAAQLHTLLNAIPAQIKLAILDTHANTAYTALAEAEANYTMLLAAYPGKMAYEHVFELQGTQVPGGVFSGCLTSVLARVDAASLTYGALLDEIIDEMRRLAFDQVPMFVGNREQVVLTRDDIHLSLWWFSQRERFESADEDALEAVNQVTRSLNRLGVRFPAAWVAVGRVFLSLQMFAETFLALERALQEHGHDHPRTNLLLGEALVMARRYGEARRHIEMWAESDEDTVQAQALIETVKRLERGTGHAVLVGIDRYAGSDVPALAGAVADADAVRKALVKRFGFPTDNVKVLLNEHATRRAVLDEFRALALTARQEVGVFFFAGYGSLGSDAQPTLVPYDSRTEGVFDIDLAELAAAAQPEHSNLVAIFDSGFTRMPKEGVAGSRYLRTDSRARPATRGMGGIVQKLVEGITRDLSAQHLQIGAATVYSGSITHSFRADDVALEGEVRRRGGRAIVRGYLTTGLMEVLAREDFKTLTYAKCAKSAGKITRTHEPAILSSHLDEPIFVNYTLHDAARTEFRRIGQRRFHRLILNLQRLIERTPRRPHLYLDLGLAFAAIGEPVNALQKLRTAVNLYEDPSIFEQESKLDPMAFEVQRQARYHLGRLLYEQQLELGKAIEELRKARDQDPDDARVHYYLGQALRALVERENLREAQQALQIYLDKGAPLGHKEEVRSFVLRSG